MQSSGVKSIDEYIEAFPGDVQLRLQQLRQTIRKAAPEAEETISYQIPTFKLRGFLVHFAAYKNHIGFYPTSSGVRAFRKELARYEGSTGTVRFPMNKPLPLSLVSRIVKFRVRENLGKGGKSVIRRQTPSRSSKS